MQSNTNSAETIKGLRFIMDVSYIEGTISESELIGLISQAVQKKLMVNDLACGGKVFGFSTDYLRIDSPLNSVETEKSCTQ